MGYESWERRRRGFLDSITMFRVIFFLGVNSIPCNTSGPPTLAHGRLFHTWLAALPISDM